MEKRRVKYCPRCGAENNIEDSYCINCGYSFIKRKKKKTNIILIIILILIFLWIFYTTFTEQPLIPKQLTELLKSFNLPKIKN